MERREHPMAGQRRLQRKCCRGLITRLTNDEDFGIQAQDMAQYGFKCHADFLLHLDLLDAWQYIFYRVVHRDDICLRHGKLCQRCVKRRRFAGPHGARKNRDPRRTMEQGAQTRLLVFEKSKLLHTSRPFAVQQETQDHHLSLDRRHRRDAHIHLPRVPVKMETAILRLTRLAGIHFRTHFHARQKNSSDLPRQRLLPFLKKPVHTDTDAHVAPSHGLDMDIACMQGDGLREDIRNELRDGSVVIACRVVASAHLAALRTHIEKRRLHECLIRFLAIHRHATRPPLDPRSQIGSCFR